MTIRQKVLTAAVLGSLAIGAPAMAAPQPKKAGPQVVTAAPKPKKQPAPQVESIQNMSIPNMLCRDLKVGQEAFFGISWRVMYSLKITGVEKDAVTVSVKLPYGSPLPSVVLVNALLQVNGIRIPCQPDKTMGNSAAPNRGITSTLESISEAFQSPSMRGKVNFTVAESTPDEIILKTKDGQRIRLDRKIDMHIEFITETAGYFQMPYKIESITVDSGSKATVKLVRDCSRFGRAEVLMSESHIFSVGCEKP